jgi:hypothetical protein
MLQQIESRLDQVYNLATIEAKTLGILWYELAYKESQKLSREFNVPVFKVVGVMAALSPNNKWERNLIDTRIFLKTPSVDTKVCTFKNQRIKALKILSASSSSEIRSILSGRKTISFFDNIFKHKIPHKVTVDLWMYRMSQIKQTNKNYEAISQAVINLSNKYSLLPHQFQAIVWSVVRPTKGVKNV